MQVTATEAKNRFGYVCAQAKAKPVFAEKDGRINSVIVSVQDFEAAESGKSTQDLGGAPKGLQPNPQSMDRRAKLTL